MKSIISSLTILTPEGLCLFSSSFIHLLNFSISCAVFYFYVYNFNYSGSHFFDSVVNDFYSAVSETSYFNFES